MHQDEMIASEIRRNIAEMLQFRMSGQVDRLLRHFSPTTLVHCASSREGLLGPGVWEGVEALGSVFRLTDENYQPLEHEILDILVQGQRAAVRWRGAWRRHATSRVYMKDAANFLRWENGFVVEMYEFFEHTSVSAPNCIRVPSAKTLWMEQPPGLGRDEIERRARKLIAISSNGPDVGLLREYCSPDVLCDFVGDRARIPYAGRHIGVEALINIVRASEVDFEQSRCEISEILIEDGRVAGRRSVEWRHRGTARRGLVNLASFMRFENGLIVELIQFHDIVTMLEMRGEMDPR